MLGPAAVGAEHEANSSVKEKSEKPAGHGKCILRFSSGHSPRSGWACHQQLTLLSVALQLK